MRRKGAGKTSAIIQARMGSTRLPGKVMMDVGGATLLARVVGRTKRAELLDEVVVAATTDERDAAIVRECEALDIPVMRGSIEDVLERYCETAQDRGCRNIVRITSDNPFADPEIMDEVIRFFIDHDCDYASNAGSRLPLGLGVEVIGFEALERARLEAKEPYERAHVTPYIYQNPERFRIGNVKIEGDCPPWRWTVDTPQDLELARTLYGRLGNRDDFSWKEAAELMRQDPALEKINAEIEQKKLEQG